jgi:hypothetical protein
LLFLFTMPCVISSHINFSSLLPTVSHLISLQSLAHFFSSLSHVCVPMPHLFIPSLHPVMCNITTQIICSSLFVLLFRFPCLPNVKFPNSYHLLISSPDYFTSNHSQKYFISLRGFIT